MTDPDADLRARLAEYLPCRSLTGAHCGWVSYQCCITCAHARRVLPLLEDIAKEARDLAAERDRLRAENERLRDEAARLAGIEETALNARECQKRAEAENARLRQQLEER